MFSIPYQPLCRQSSISRMEMDWLLFMTGTTETWRKGRKILDGSLRPGAMMSYRQMMEEKTRDLLAQLRATPKDLHVHSKLSAGRLSYIVRYWRPGSLQEKLIMSLTYGYDLKKGDKLLEAPEKTSEVIKQVIQPGALLVNYFPLCAVSGFTPVMLAVLIVTFSAVYSFMGTIHQLRTTGGNI
jgi:hypothetical protein